MKKPLPKIKDCPFCGLSGDLVEGNDFSEKLFVACVGSRCHAMGPRRDTVRGAINAWNARKVERNG